MLAFGFKQRNNKVKMFIEFFESGRVEKRDKNKLQFLTLDLSLGLGSFYSLLQYLKEV